MFPLSLTLFLFVFLIFPNRFFNTVQEQNGDRKIELIYEDLGTSYVTFYFIYLKRFMLYI